MRLVTTIDGAVSSDFIGLQSLHVVRDRLGRIITAKSLTQIPQVFDSAGRFLRDLTTKGNGPGEIPSITWMDRVGDTLVVISPDRTTHYDLDLKYVTVRRGAGAGMRGNPLSVVRLSDRAMAIVSALIEPNGPGRFAMPVYIRDTAGSNRQRLVIGDVVDGAQRLELAAAKDSGRFWGIGLRTGGGYFVALYDQAGRETKRLERRPSWWISAPDGQYADARSAPQGIRVDSLGRVFVIIRQPKKNWRDIPTPNGDQTVRYDTVVEIIDSRKGSLLTHRVAAGSPVRIVDDAHFATYTEGGDYPVLRIWRVAF